MSEEIIKLQLRKVKLLQAIEDTKQKKEKIISVVQDFVKQLNSGRITRKEYEEKLNSVLNKRTAEQWIKYYDDYIKYYEYQVKLCDKLIAGEKKKEKLEEKKEKITIYEAWEGKKRKSKLTPILIILISVVLIVIIISLFVDLKPIGINVFSKIGEKVSETISHLIGEAPEVPAVAPVSEFIEPTLAVNLDDKTIKISGEELTQYQAVIGKNVKWKKQFAVDSITGFSVELPIGSENIEIKVSGKDITNIADISKKRKFFIFGEKAVEVRLSKKSITGNAISDNPEKQEFEIIYETPAPEIDVVQEGLKTNLKITGPDDIHYKDIFSFAKIPEVLKIGEENKLRLYQTKQDGIESKEQIPITLYDTDENGLYDKVEWITPGLSDWEGYLIIEISKAEHLNSTKGFISDIYEQVKELDGVWSETINENEYVKVTFQKKLDNSRDITIYPRIVSGNPRIEVYESEGIEKIAEFDNLISNQYNKVYLTELLEEQDVFDLRVVNGSLEIEHIIDPSINYCGCNVTATSLSVTCSVFCNFNFSVPPEMQGKNAYIDWVQLFIKYCNKKTSDTSKVEGWIDRDNQTGNGTEARIFNMSKTSANDCPSGTSYAQNRSLNYSDGFNNLNCPNFSQGYCSWQLFVNGTTNGSSSVSRTIIVNITGVYYSWAVAVSALPNINFTYPTPLNNSIQYNQDIFVNVSANGSSVNISVFIDFDKSLIGWWRMDDVSGVYSENVLDSSEYGNNGLATGAAQVYGGFLGQGFSFDGIDDYIMINSSRKYNNLNKSFSVSFWVNKKGEGTGGSIGYFSHRNNSINRGWAIVNGSNNRISLYNGTYRDSNIIINNNVWNHVVVVVNSTNVIFYNNGAFDSFTGFSSGDDTGVGLIMGRAYNDVDNYYLNGTLDDVMIFNRSLTGEEVAALYANSSTKYLEVNFLGLSAGNHTFKAYVQDEAGNVNMTEKRQVNIAIEEINSCGKVLNRENSVYILINNIINNTLKDNCINITAQNITLDCKGYYIKSDDAFSGIYFNSSYTTIKNCNITMSNSGGYGIYLYGANNSYIFNNILNEQDKGLYLVYTSSTKIENITTIDNWGSGIYFNSSSNNTLRGHNSTYDNYGIYFRNSSYNNITGVYINESYEDGIVFFSSSNNNVQRVYVWYSYDEGIYMEDSNNNTLEDLEIVGDEGTNGIRFAYLSSYNLVKKVVIKDMSGVGIMFFSSANSNKVINGNVTSWTTTVSSGLNSKNNTFLNVSYNTSKEYVSSDSQLIRKWYYQAKVNDTAGNNIVNANVTAYNVTGNYQFNLTTDASGFTPVGEIIDYINNGTRNYYSNYTIYADNKTNFLNHKLNVTWKSEQSGFGGLVFDVFTFEVGGAEIPVTNCMVLDQANKIYNQTANIENNAITSACINITAQNITFNCYGYYIKSNQPYTGIYSNQYNTTIKNCNISMGSESGEGIYLQGANNSYIFNNSLNGQFYGLALTSTQNTRIENIIANSNQDSGIYLESSSNNTFTNITANSNPFGIFLYKSANNNQLANITANSNSNDGITILSSNLNTFTNLKIDTNLDNSNDGAIYISFSNNSLFKNSNFATTQTYIINLVSSSKNNTFLNVTYNSSKESVSSNSQLIRKWYYQAYVNDTEGNIINGANISVYNRTNFNNFNLTTGEDGFTAVVPIIDYISNGTRNYYSNYTINTTNGISNESHKLNITLKSGESGFGGFILDVITLKVGKVAPKIIWVENISSVSPWNGKIQDVNFKFTAYDGNGYANLNDSSAKANFSKIGYEQSRTSLSCVRTANWDIYYANYTCIIGMLYFDEGGDWNISVSIEDNDQFFAINGSTSFKYEYLIAVSNPSVLDWGALASGSINKPVIGNPIIANNTGNMDISVIKINGSNLINGTYFIGVSNFSVNTSDGGGNGALLISNFLVDVFNSSLPSRNSTSSGIINLYFYIKQVPYGLPPLTYQTDPNFPWVIGFAVLISINAKKKKKKINIPLNIFSLEIAPAEVLCKYLRENKGLSVGEITRLINRNKSSVSINYKNAVKKIREKIKEDRDLFVDINILSNRKLSISESLVNHLKKKGYRNIEIARLLNKDQRNISTLYSRVQKKLKRKLIEKKEIEVPVKIFRYGGSGVLYKYLRENIGLGFNEIARLTNREDSTVWMNYRNVNQRIKKIKEEDEITISIKAFSNRKLSVLEVIINYLKKKGMRNCEIADILNKDQRVIGTLYSRINKKLE